MLSTLASLSPGRHTPAAEEEEVSSVRPAFDSLAGRRRCDQSERLFIAEQGRKVTGEELRGCPETFLLPEQAVAFNEKCQRDRSVTLRLNLASASPRALYKVFWKPGVLCAVSSAEDCCCASSGVGSRGILREI